MKAVHRLKGLADTRLMSSEAIAELIDIADFVDKQFTNLYDKVNYLSRRHTVKKQRKQSIVGYLTKQLMQANKKIDRQEKRIRFLENHLKQIKIHASKFEVSTDSTIWNHANAALANYKTPIEEKESQLNG